MKVWSGDSASMYAEKDGGCYDVVSQGQDTAACDQTSHSLCEKTCGGGDQATDPPLECMAAQRSPEGDYVTWVRDSCLQENRFICERPQTYAAEEEQFLEDAYGTLPLSRKLGPREAAQRPLQTWETNVGYDDLLTPASMLGSALFGGYPAYRHSYVEIKLVTQGCNSIQAYLIELQL